MHKLSGCVCISQDFAQSQKFFARSHDRETVTFRNSDFRKHLQHRASIANSKDMNSLVEKRPWHSLVHSWMKLVSLVYLRGSSHMILTKNGGYTPPLPPLSAKIKNGSNPPILLVRKNQNLDNHPSPLSEIIFCRASVYFNKYTFRTKNCI